MNKKGIGPVIAVALLLVVSVVAVLGFQTWYGMYSSELFSNTETQSQEASSSTEIETIVGDKLYINSPSNENSTINKILIDGIECNFVGNISGIQDISIEDCLESSNSKTTEVVVITDNEIITKKVYLKDKEISTSSQKYFVSIWNTSVSGTGTTSNSTQVTLPIYSGGNYDFYISGENLIGSPVHINDATNRILNFNSSGIQEISINGTIEGFSFGYSGDRNKLIEIKSWGPLNVGNNNGYFYGCENLQITANDILNLTGTTDLSYMFAYASKISSIPNLNNWDFSEVTDISHMFENAINFNQDLSSWDTSEVTTMEGTFNFASSFNQDLSSWDTGNVITIYVMFNYASSFDQSLGDWNISSLVSIYDSFVGSNMSTENYSDTLIKWNSQSSIPSSLDLDATGINYNSSAVTARNNLISTYSWSISDAGLE